MALQQFIDAAGNWIPVDVNNPFPISRYKKASVEFARPADTTAYAALDVIADSTSAPTILTFSNVARGVGGSGAIIRARIMTDSTAPSTASAVFVLHLFHAQPASLINDNSPYPMIYTNKDKRIGKLTFPAATTEGTGSTACSARISNDYLAFICEATSTNIYGILQTNTVFTPTSAQNFYIDLIIDQL